MSKDIAPIGEELCLVDSGTTNSILREIKYFQTLKKREGKVLTIAGSDTVIVGSGRAIITLPMGTQITIEDALLYPDSTRTLLSYRDIRQNGFHIETHMDNREEFLLLTKQNGYGKRICEKIPSLTSGLYYTYIKPIAHVAYKVIFQNVDAFHTWHDRLGHPEPNHLNSLNAFKEISVALLCQDLDRSGYLFIARFADSIFDEEHFPALGGEFKYQKECQEIDWDAQGIPVSDPRTTEAELQVQKIIHLQRLANNLPDAFTNFKGVTKSFIPAQNAPERVEVPNKTTQLPLTKKRGRSMATQRETIANKQRKTVNANQPLVGTHQIDTICQADHDSLQPSSVVHNAETRNSEDHRHIVSGDHNESIRVDEIAINYSETRESFDRRATIVDTNFSEQIAECLQVDPEPRSIKECQKRFDWNKWKDAIDIELASLYKRDVFSAVMPTPRGIFPMGYKWVFVRKRNENNEVMDVVTAYLYGSLDSDIYMKVPGGIDIPNQKGYTKNDDCPCVFIKKSPTGFCIISVYVDDLSIIGNTQDINEARHHLKTEFEMKDLGQTKFCLGLQLEHLPSGILVHQSAYTQKILEKFNMDKSYPSKIPMVVRSLDVEKDPFRPKEDGEDVLGPDFPYLSAIGALMYLANSTRPDIAFSVNLLARYSAAPTKHHWTGVKNVFRYLNGTRDLGLFFKKNQDSTLIGYTDASYLSDPHNARSQTGFVFLQGGTAISWKSSKQTLVATSTNHSEIIALYEASRECVWLRRMVNHILTSCGIGSLESPTIIYEDNAACVVQMKTGYIKSNITKHIAPKLFYPHELQQHGEINILQTKSCDNLADLFTKSLPYSTFFKYVEGIGMRRLKNLQDSRGVSSSGK
uniref:OSJNBa0065J03.17 protein n=1 Tax=Oryza sativa subsp. japonica TaxID=39947 RepID=Q7XVV5_ORYSJ|nr:OSJNBa0065J03.17 [Oryza sativa Japonica Group]